MRITFFRNHQKLGGGGSKIERDLGESFPDDEHYLGLFNVCHASTRAERCGVAAPLRCLFLYIKKVFLSETFRVCGTSESTMLVSRYDIIP